MVGTKSFIVSISNTKEVKDGLLLNRRKYAKYSPDTQFEELYNSLMRGLFGSIFEKDYLRSMIFRMAELKKLFHFAFESNLSKMAKIGRLVSSFLIFTIFFAKFEIITLIYICKKQYL